MLKQIKRVPKVTPRTTAEGVETYTQNKMKACEKLLADKNLKYADIEGSTHRLERDSGMPIRREEISKFNGFLVLGNQIRN